MAPSPLINETHDSIHSPSAVNIMYVKLCIDIEINEIYKTYKETAKQV